jgi:hypothetical protein
MTKSNPKVYGTHPDIDVEDYGGKLSSHISGEWTSPSHWAHDNYQRGHLPQLCILASGWKARILAFLLSPWMQ